MKRAEVKRDIGAVVGCYTMHLYCQHPNAGKYVCTFYPLEIVGETRAGCLRTARAGGWWISAPDHNGDCAVLCAGHAR